MTYFIFWQNRMPTQNWWIVLSKAAVDVWEISRISRAFLTQIIFQTWHSVEKIIRLVVVISRLYYFNFKRAIIQKRHNIYYSGFKAGIWPVAERFLISTHQVIGKFTVLFCLFRVKAIIFTDWIFNFESALIFFED